VKIYQKDNPFETRTDPFQIEGYQKGNPFREIKKVLTP
jgi:hypothetical protein